MKQTPIRKPGLRIWITAALIAVILGFACWLLRFYISSHTEVRESTGLTVTQEAQLICDRSNNLRGTIYDGSGRSLASTEEYPVEPEPGPGEDTKEDEADSSVDTSLWESSSFLDVFRAYASGIPTPDQAAAAAAEDAASEEDHASSQTVRRRHVADEYSETLSAFLGPYDLERIYDLFLVNGNFNSECHFRKEGDSIYLTLDAELSEQIRRLLVKEGVTKGGAVVMDVQTGAVIGMVSLPTYDINAIYTGDTAAMAAYEAQDSELYYNQMAYARNLGSVCKPISALAILRSGIDQNFLETGSLALDNSPIHNVYGHNHDGETLDLNLAMKYSSNTYFASKLVEAAPTGSVQEIVESLMLDESQSIPTDFCTLSGTYVYTSDAELGMNAYGQAGFTISPLQLCACYAALVNGGDLMQPYIVDSIVSPSGKTVSVTKPTILNEGVASDLESEAILTALTISGNSYTGLNPSDSSFSIAAKSGTAQIYTTDDSGAIVEGINTVMAGVFPADAPQYAIVVMEAEERNTSSIGSQHAPTVRAIADLVMSRTEAP